MAQGVISRPVIADAWVLSPLILHDTYEVQIGPELGSSPSNPLFPCQYHSTIASHSSPS